ncbi:hypothetical protein [Streptomyces sp. NPDC058671]|uniref:hypothetical protein n=1 Tax=Streptomyces sp. NPDC058671 TaxID=3346590 RepID=UPI00364E1A8E
MTVPIVVAEKDSDAGADEALEPVVRARAPARDAHGSPRELPVAAGGVEGELAEGGDGEFGQGDSARPDGMSGDVPAGDGADSGRRLGDVVALGRGESRQQYGQVRGEGPEGGKAAEAVDGHGTDASRLPAGVLGRVDLQVENSAGQTAVRHGL